MTDKDRQYLDDILERHNEAVGAFHQARAAMIEANAGVQQMFEGARVTFANLVIAHAAQNEALEDIMAANRAALLWLRSKDKE